MSLTFKDLQDEVKRRATRDQGGTNFNTAANNLVNSSLIRVANEAPWRSLRRESTFDTVGEFTTGTVSATVGSKVITFSGSNLITNGVVPGRRISFGSGSSTLHTIATITGENAATIDLVFDGTAALSGSTFTIFGQETYNLPVQTGRLALLWHEGFDTPVAMEYITERAFIESGWDFDDSDTPEVYWMWGEDWANAQPRQASIMTAVSSSTSDTTQTVTVFGTVSGFPDFEEISLNGTTEIPGSKLFSNVERVVKNANTVGRITVTSNNGEETVATMPVGDTTSGIKYKKVRVYPSPDTIYKINVVYYKEPFRMVNDNDIHELGQDFDEAIILLATAKFQGEQSKRDIDKFAALYGNELSILRRKNADKLDWLPRRERPSQAGRGRFGRGGPHPQASYSQWGSKFGPQAHGRY